MLENATSLTIQLEEIGYIKLKTFFSEPYAGNVLIFTLILVTIGGAIMATLASLWIRKRNRFQQRYEDWLKPRTIRFTFSEKGLICPQQNDEERWPLFFKAVKRSRHYVFKGRVHYKKAEKAVDKYNRLANERVKPKITSIVTQIIDNADLGFAIVDDGNGKPHEYARPNESIVLAIIEIVTSELERTHKKRMSIGKSADGRFVLYGGDRLLAKSSSEDRLKSLMNSYQSVADDNEVINIVKDLMDAEQEARKTVDAYNKVLVNVIQKLGF